MSLTKLTRQQQNCLMLAVFMGGTFVCLFLLNYELEARAYSQLRELLNGTDGARYGLTFRATPRKRTINVATYHERYEVLVQPWLSIAACAILVLALLIGFLIWRAEGRGGSIALWTAIAIYLSTPILMNTLVYQDMMGIILIAWIFFMLFFTGRGIQRFNPHREPGLDWTGDAQFQALLQIYQRMFLVSLAVVGFVAATFMTATSGLLRDILERTAAGEVEVYRAVHMPYLEGAYGFAAIGCISFAVLVTRECHLKMHELIRMRAGLVNASKGRAAERIKS